MLENTVEGRETGKVCISTYTSNLEESPKTTDLEIQVLLEMHALL